MRVAYDEQIFLAQSRGGISRYFARLIAAFAADPGLGVEPTPGWRTTPNLHAHELGLSRPIGRAPTAPTPSLLRQAVHALANTPSRRALTAAPILHHTYYHPRFLRPDYRGLRVSTVHDMAPELFPELYGRRNPHLAKERYVAASDLVVCVSESARRDLISVYGVPDAQVIVAPHGVDPVFSAPAKGSMERDNLSVLYVGRRDLYKDFDVLVRALTGLQEPHIHLTAVGGGSFTAAEMLLLRGSGLVERVRQVDVDDHALADLYRRASLLAFPSRYEGFGMPALEAMASATPVVLADAPAQREVAGDVGVYFPAGDSAALGRAIGELLADEGRREELGRRGTVRASQFTWARSAELTAAAYAALLESRS